MFKVAFQGESGAYSDAAAQECLGEDIQTIGMHSFELVFEAVEAGDALFVAYLF
jgi:prephenate dehydratase